MPTKFFVVLLPLMVLVSAGDRSRKMEYAMVLNRRISNKEFRSAK